MVPTYFCIWFIICSIFNNRLFFSISTTYFLCKWNAFLVRQHDCYVVWKFLLCVGLYGMEHWVSITGSWVSSRVFYMRICSQKRNPHEYVNGKIKTLKRNCTLLIGFLAFCVMYWFYGSITFGHRQLCNWYCWLCVESLCMFAATKLIIKTVCL